MTNAMTEMKAPTPHKPLSEIHNRLNCVISELDARLSTLITEIRPVLAEIDSDPGETETKPDLTRSEMARALSYETERLENLCKVVGDVIMRVEC